MQGDTNPDNPYRGPYGVDRRAIPLALGLVLAVLFGLVTSMADASGLARAAIGVPLLGAFVAWAVVYAIPEPSARAGRRGGRGGPPVGLRSDRFVAHPSGSADEDRRARDDDAAHGLS
jgi:hypothetical protein